MLSIFLDSNGHTIASRRRMPELLLRQLTNLKETATFVDEATLTKIKCTRQVQKQPQQQAHAQMRSCEHALPYMFVDQTKPYLAKSDSANPARSTKKAFVVCLWFGFYLPTFSVGWLYVCGTSTTPRLHGFVASLPTINYF